MIHHYGNFLTKSEIDSVKVNYLQICNTVIILHNGSIIVGLTL